MKKIIYTAITAAIISLSAFTFLSDWKVKPSEAVVEFKGGNISGAFKELKADISFDKEHPEQAKMTASITVESIATGFFLKNSHAKDALDADKYPTIKFVSSAVSKAANGYVAKGILTMKGVTKPISINFTFDDKGSQGVFKGSFKFAPKEYGITRNGTPEEMMINLSVPVTKA